MAGRINPYQGGGPQSCTREMKAAMYSGIEWVRNYDLKSSQPRLLQDEIRQAGLGSEWLDEYLGSEKAIYAERVGLPVDAWKVCVLALMIGGPNALPRRREQEALHVLREGRQGGDGVEVRGEGDGGRSGRRRA